MPVLQPQIGTKKNERRDGVMADRRDGDMRRRIDAGGHVNVLPQTSADRSRYAKSLPEAGLDDSPKAIEQEMRRERGGYVKIDSSKTMMGKEIK